MRILLLVAAALLGVGDPGVTTPAAGSQTVVAVAFTYLPPTVQLTAGDALRFRNLDPAGSGGHSVTSDTQRPETGDPLFTSDTLAAGAEGDVAGVTVLPPGSYAFTCRVHGFMQGTLVVS